MPSTLEGNLEPLHELLNHLSGVRARRSKARPRSRASGRIERVRHSGALGRQEAHFRDVLLILRGIDGGAIARVRRQHAWTRIHKAATPLGLWAVSTDHDRLSCRLDECAREIAAHGPPPAIGL